MSSSRTQQQTGGDHPVRSAIGSAALGYVAPWSTPVRMITSRVVARRANKAAAKAATKRTPRIPAPSLPSIPSLPQRGRSSRRRSRTGLVVVGIAAVVGVGVAVTALRSGRRTPPPVAAHPPRVEDVPTSTGDRATDAE